MSVPPGQPNGPGPPTGAAPTQINATNPHTMPMPFAPPISSPQFDMLAYTLAAGGFNPAFNPAFLPFAPPMTNADGSMAGMAPMSVGSVGSASMPPPTAAGVSGAGTKHALTPTPSGAAEEQPVKRQKVDAPTGAATLPALESAGATTSADSTTLSAPATGDQPPSAQSPSPSANGTTDAAAANADHTADASLEPADPAIVTAKAHLSRLAAWTASEQEEVRFLQSILVPDSTVSYLDYTRPYTEAFSVVDQATPIPSFAIAQAAAAAAAPAANVSRLSRAAGAQHAQSATASADPAASAAAVAPPTGPTIEELEARRAFLANRIKLFQADSGRKLDKSLEPPRNKCHWDYVLAEMEWMASDFQRERKWKVNLAKKVSRAILNHHKKEVGKEFKQLRDEVVQRRRRAAWVSREIKKFWSNIGKLVKHKHQTIVEEEKKKQMDRHLEILVDQTESFSTKLAADLTGKGVGQAAAPTTSDNDNSTQSSDNKDANSAASRTPSATPTPAAAAASAVSPPAQDEESTNTDGIDVGRVDDILQSLKGPDTSNARRSTRTHKPTATPAAAAATAAAAAASAAAADDTNDADFGEDESEEDEEGTLSEEEEAEAAEAGGTKRSDAAQAEVNALQAEAEMSIEELRKLYGGADDEEDGGEEEEEEEEEQDGDEEEEEGGDDAAAPSSSPTSSAAAASPSFSDDEEQDDAADDSDEDGGDVPVEEEQKSNTTVLLEQAGAVTEEQRMTVASNLAASAQPTGHTLKEQKVKTKVPFLIRGPGPLREYQHIGLDWLVSMYDNGLNGILADEMGLGKTVMSISLLAHLAVERGIWGQHLIVVPTSVIVNWEMEFKRWLPGFKILCYHGSAKDRKMKRRGWSDENQFHVCITSYQLVLQDARIFKRKKWHYLILDEAHNIKNFKSQRWQTLLNFRTHRRLLLTGTPLQNSCMELWALMHFLMPNIFQSQTEFKTWFSNPVSAMVEGKDSMNQKLLARLHGILRPFLLRRLKTSVAQQLPNKYEHVLYCKLSKRQRYLYEDFMAASDTQKTLASGNFMGMMNVVMSLRKVCNHPDLFSGRAIVSPFDQFEPITLNVPSRVLHLCPTNADDRPLVGRGGLDLESRHLLLMAHQLRTVSRWESERVHSLATPQQVIEQISASEMGDDPFENEKYPIDPIALPFVNQLRAQRLQWRTSRRVHMAALNAVRTRATDCALFEANLMRLCHVTLKTNVLSSLPERTFESDPNPTPVRLVTSYAQRADQEEERIQRVCCIIPRARAKPPQIYVNRPDRSRESTAESNQLRLLTALSPATTVFRTSFARQQIFFPDKYLLQWDCGKLQRLAQLLRERQAGGHRVLIFSQFSKMLDILEAFLSMHGYRYLRLDGSTKVDERQRLMERFNRDNKYFVFVLSTRSGGVGINLTGADTCVMYDSDWNPAMDLQAQDRAHRIGQTKEVNIFRLITERTIEENILKKSNQKRDMNNAVIGDGNFNTDFLEKLDPRELLGLQKSEASVAAGGATIEEMKDGDSVEPPTVKLESSESLAQQIERQRAEMASLEDEVDRVALQQSLAETQADIDDFTAGEVGEKARARAAAAVPQSGRTTATAADLAPATTSASIRSMGKVGAVRGKQSTSTIPVVAAFENSLTPVQRYALHFSEFIDPLITAQQMRATQKQLQIEEAKWAAKQAVGTSVAVNNTASADDAMDVTTDTPDVKPTIKLETDAPSVGAPSPATSPFPVVKKEPLDPSGVAPLTSSSSSVPSSSSLPPSTSSSDSKNVLAGSRPLEDQYHLDQFKLAHPSFYRQLQQSHHHADVPLIYEYPFQQPEYQWQQQQQQAILQQQQAAAAAIAAHKAAHPGAPVPPTPPTPTMPSIVAFGTLPTNAIVNHPYFNSSQRKLWQSRAYRSVLRAMANRGFRELHAGAPLRDAPPSPTSDDLVTSSDEDDAEYGLFSTPDAISRMLGPKLRHAERAKQAAKARAGAAAAPHADAKSAAVASARRRVVGVDGEVRVAFVSSDNTDPVSIRIPWLKLKTGGIDRSFLVLSRAGVDYPAKTNTYRGHTQTHAAGGIGATMQQTNANEEAMRAKMRLAYDGLKVDGIVPFHAGLQQRHLSATSLVLPTPKRPLTASNAKPLPAAAAGGGSNATEVPVHTTSTPPVDATRKKREGLFAVRPGSAVARPRALQVDESVTRERLLNWSPDEDHVLLACIDEYGPNWSLTAQVLQATPRLAGRLRSSKEVMHRYAWIQHKKNGGADLPPQTTKPTGVPTPNGPPAGSAPTAGGPSAPASAATAAPAAEGETDESKKKRNKDGKLKDSKKGEKKHSSADASSAAAASAAAAAAAAGAPTKKQKTGAGPPGATGATVSLGFGSKQLVSYVDRATKQMKQEQLSARAQLRASFHLPATEDPNQKQSVNLPLHPSHRTVILEAHNKLGLPSQAMGKTLMPHQIIQLRMRRQQHRAAGGMMDDKGRMVPGPSSSAQQQQQQGGPSGQQMPMGMQSGHPGQSMPPGGRSGYPQQQGNMPPQQMQQMGGGGNMAPPSNQRLNSAPNMSGGNMQQGRPGSMQQGGGGNMPPGGGGGGGMPYQSNQQQRSSSGGGGAPNQPYNNQAPSGNYNNAGGNYAPSSQQGASNYPQQQQQGYSNNAPNAYPNSSGTSAPQMQRYQTAPTGSNNNSGQRSNNNNAPMNSQGSYAPNNNAPYNNSNPQQQQQQQRGGNYNGSSGGGVNAGYNNQSGGGSSNYYPPSGNTGGGNYNPSVSPPPGSSTLMPPNSSGGGGQQQSGSSRSKSPAAINSSYAQGGSYPPGNVGGPMNVMMNASGAPTPNIPPANTNYYQSSGGSSNNMAAASGNNNFNYSSTSGGSGGQFPASRTSSGGSYQQQQSSGGGGYSNTGTGNNYSSGGPSPPLTDDDHNLNQLLAWVGKNAPMVSKPALEVFHRAGMTAKQKFDAVTNLLSKGM